MNTTSTSLLFVLLLSLSTSSATALAPNSNSLNAVLQQLNNNTTITGSVTSAQTKLPLAGVAVSLKGSSQATITDNNGNFSLEIDDPAKAIIVFSHENYDQQEVKIANQSVITISLTETQLVTTALGIKRKSESLSYSLTEIKGDELTNVAQENFLNSLAGRVAGLNISQTSGIGSSVNVALRGIRSLSNDNQPLYVVDGILMTSPLNSVTTYGIDIDYGSLISAINPEDIESISILRGFNSSSLYGLRGNNGAILITTKSGNKGLNVHFSTSNVVEKPYRFLDYHYKLANGIRPDKLDESFIYWAGPELDKGITAIQWNSPLDASGNPIPTELKSFKNNVKNFLQPAITTLNNLSISGGSNKVSYRAGLNLMRNQGLIPGSDLYRNGITAAIQYQPVKSVKISSNFSYISNGSGSTPSTSNATSNPIQAAYAYSHVDIRELENYWVPGEEYKTQRTVSPGIDNPYFLAKGINNSYERIHTMANLKIDWQILPSLQMYTRITRNEMDNKQETKIPWGYSRSKQGGYYLESLKMEETNIESMLAFRKKIRKVEFTISGGGNRTTRENYASSAGGNSLINPNLFELANIQKNYLGYSHFSSESRVYSFMAYLSTNFKSEVYLDFATRKDWTSTFAKNDRSQLYSSIGMSWLANRTFKIPTTISMLKLRASFSKNGNNNSTINGITFPKPDQYSSSEAGLDISFFENRLRLEGTYSLSNCKTGYFFNLPGSIGNQPTAYTQIELIGHSLEVVLSGTPIVYKNGWSANAGLNLSRQRTRVDVPTGLSFIQTWSALDGSVSSKNGELLGSLYSKKYLQVTDNQSPYYLWPIVSNDGVLQTDNSSMGEKTGNIYPNFVLGGQLSIAYKKLTLTASFDWRNGGQFVSYTYRYAGEQAQSSRRLNTFPGGNYSTDELIRILKSDPEKYIIPQQGNFPVVGGYNKETGGFAHSNYDQYDGIFFPGVQLNPDGSYTENLGGSETKFLPFVSGYAWNFNKAATFDADFIKLREITLSYTAKIGKIKNAQFSIYSRNIMLWTKAKIGIDPERAYQNIGGAFRQGIESQNINPWTIPFGVKIAVSL